jgi:alpha-amylase/alpha-mannosidase (GH57 family)
MPLLADTGALDDLRLHINLSNGLFRRYLGVEPSGVWPPEQAVNDEVLMLFAEAGYSWTVTDEDVLRATLPDASLQALLRRLRRPPPLRLLQRQDAVGQPRL